VSIIHTDQRLARLGIAVALLFGWLVVTALPASADATISVTCEQYGVALSGYPEAARGVVNSVSIIESGTVVESSELFSSSFSIRRNWTEFSETHQLIVEVSANSDQDGSDGLTFVDIQTAKNCLPILEARATCDGWSIGVYYYKPPGTRLTMRADDVTVLSDVGLPGSNPFEASGIWPISEGTHSVQLWVTSDDYKRSDSDIVFDCPGATATTTATTLPPPTTPTTFDSSAPTTLPAPTITDATVAGDQVSDTPEASSSTTLVATSTTVDLSSEQSPSDAPGSVAAGSSPGPPSSTNPIVLVLAAIGLVSIGGAGGVLLVKRLRK